MIALQQYGISGIALVALTVFLFSMGKGGFPIGSVALPLLVLVWPGDNEPAKAAVSFMLPLLCVMDLVAMLFYWRNVRWEIIRPLLPGTIAGIAAGSLLFVTGDNAVTAISDRGLKFLIGLIGLLFVVNKAVQKWVNRKLADSHPGIVKTSGFGFTAGLTSTIAHAAGPVMQMYMLPLNMEKMKYVATYTAFFWVMNLVKMVPFSVQGRITGDNLFLSLFLLPVVPVGVAAGYLLVRVTKASHYVALIYAILAITSAILIYNAC